MSFTGNARPRTLTFNRKDHVVHAEQQHQHFFILIDGMVARERHLADGRRQIVGLHVPGDVCGLTGLSDGCSDYGMVALSAVACIPFEDRWLTSIARNSIELCQAVWRELAREAALSAAWTVNIGQRSAYQRLAYFVCETQARLHSASHGAEAEFEWPGNQADIGAVTGLSLVHINRTIKTLEADGFATGGSRLRFRNFAKLREVAGFDPSCVARRHEALGRVLLSHFGETHAVGNGTAFDPLPHIAAAH